MIKEIIEFNGIKFYRYPESKHHSARFYFKCSKTKLVKERKASLHRYIWSYLNGDIPEGHHIHHIDGNTFNNDISNLGCVPIDKHLSDHSKSRFLDKMEREKQTERLKHLREKTKEWHRSEEGKKWHSGHRNAMKQLKIEKRCINCQKGIWVEQSFSNFKNSKRYCSRKCKTAYNRMNGMGRIDIKCFYCNKIFQVYKA